MPIAFGGVVAEKFLHGVRLLFTHPAAFLLLPLVLLAVLLGRRRSGWRWRATTALRAATLGLLIVALSGPLLRAPLAGIGVVFAVDRSLSITAEGQRALKTHLQAMELLIRAAKV